MSRTLFKVTEEAVARRDALIRELSGEITRLRARIAELEDVLRKLQDVKRSADCAAAILSNQGQALDGYSELANYRSIIAATGEVSDGEA
jgi:hypothetical protein